MNNKNVFSKKKKKKKLWSLSFPPLAVCKTKLDRTQTKEQLGKLYNVDVSTLGFYERPEAWDKWSKQSTSKQGPDMMENEQVKGTMTVKQLRGGVVVDDIYLTKNVSSNGSEGNGNETRYVSKPGNGWNENETTYMDNTKKADVTRVMETEMRGMTMEMGIKSNSLNLSSSSQQFNITNSNAIDWYLAQSETQPATLQMNEFDDDDLRTIHGTGGGGGGGREEQQEVEGTATAMKKLDKKFDDNIVIPISSSQVDRTGGCPAVISTVTSSNLRSGAVRPSGKTWVSPFPSRNENLYFFMFRYK
ncbi:hypothetical protein RFI_29888, partial [Reticulomyxa filosa]